MPPKNLRILVVCTGNICRSPMAAALLRHALDAEPEPLKSAEVRSAGVSAAEGDPASANAVRALKNVGIDLSPHRSRHAEPGLIRGADLVLAMTKGHLEAIRTLTGEGPPKVVLFRSFHAGEDAEVPDPFGASLDAYEACRDSLVEAIPDLLKTLRKTVSGPSS